MKNFQTNPMNLDDYGITLWEGERVYHIAYGTCDDAYAIREADESLEDFELEVRMALHRRHGRRIGCKAIEDVTDILANGHKSWTLPSEEEREELASLLFGC